MKAPHFFALVACFFFLAGVAAAAPLIFDVYPSIGPSPYGSISSTSMADYRVNALFALQAGNSSWGTPGTPSYYAQAAYFDGTQVIGTCSGVNCPPGTGFNSWMGQAAPPSPYSGEYGNMLFFGLVIQANPLTFDLNDITFQDTLYGITAPVEHLSSVGFGSGLIGIDASGNTCAPAGSAACDATTALKAVYFSGFGDQFVAANTTDLANLISWIQASPSPYAAGTYTLILGGSTYISEVEIGPVPEPGTMALAGLGLVLAGVFRKRLK